MTENKVLAKNAQEALKGKWGLAIGVFVIYILIVGGLGAIPIAGTIGTLLIAGSMVVGLSIFSLSIARKQEAAFGQLFEGFQRFGTALGAYLLQAIFIGIGMILLIIPGIIVAIMLSQTFFILAEDKEIGAVDALKKSKAMMDGNKMKFFLFTLRFLGWAILCMLTLGIGFLWLGPYMMVSFANFYDDIKGGAGSNSSEVLDENLVK